MRASRQHRHVAAMAVLAHLRVDSARALPPARVRVATVGTNLVATDAVRGRPRVVAARTGHDVAPRRAAVEIARGGVGTDPLAWMRIGWVGDVRAHSAGSVAGVATLDRVAREATSRLGTRLDRVANHEVTPMLVARFESLRPTSFDRQILRYVMARLTLRLRMAALTELSLFWLSHGAAVVSQELRVVLQKRAGHRAPQLFGFMAGGALALGPLLRMLVAAEALAHRR
jgi:hypothetical protein